jgi:hypothetical protein
MNQHLQPLRANALLKLRPRYLIQWPAVCCPSSRFITQDPSRISPRTIGLQSPLRLLLCSCRLALFAKLPVLDSRRGSQFGARATYSRLVIFCVFELKNGVDCRFSPGLLLWAKSSAQVLYFAGVARAVAAGPADQTRLSLGVLAVDHSGIGLVLKQRMTRDWMLKTTA